MAASFFVTCAVAAIRRAIFERLVPGQAERCLVIFVDPGLFAAKLKHASSTNGTQGDQRRATVRELTVAGSFTETAGYILGSTGPRNSV
jgi:hypothetical protein